MDGWLCTSYNSNKQWKYGQFLETFKVSYYRCINILKQCSRSGCKPEGQGVVCGETLSQHCPLVGKWCHVMHPLGLRPVPGGKGQNVVKPQGRSRRDTESLQTCATFQNFWGYTHREVNRAGLLLGPGICVHETPLPCGADGQMQVLSFYAEVTCVGLHRIFKKFLLSIFDGSIYLSIYLLIFSRVKTKTQIP